MCVADEAESVGRLGGELADHLQAAAASWRSNHHPYWAYDFRAVAAVALAELHARFPAVPE
jgi:hypothetical protein